MEWQSGLDSRNRRLRQPLKAKNKPRAQQKGVAHVNVADPLFYFAFYSLFLFLALLLGPENRVSEHLSSPGALFLRCFCRVVHDFI